MEKLDAGNEIKGEHHELRCYSERIAFTSSPKLDGWLDEAYEA